MLIDDLLASERCENILPESWPKFRNLLQSAQKFELAPDFAAAAEQLSLDYDVIANAVPHCRLPFQITWIEVAQANRPLFCAAPIHIPELQRIPHRIGFLLMAEDPDLTTFTIHQLWSIKGAHELNASHMALLMDPKEALEADPVYDPEKGEHKHFKIESSKAWHDASAVARGQLTQITTPILPYYRTGIETAFGDNTMGEIFTEIGAADWSGEVGFLLATLALLNTVNTTERTAVDTSGMNKQRAKKRKPLLQEYHILGIAPRLKDRMGISHGVNGHHDIRWHLCRGHFKVRKTGVFWWRPHSRGDRASGKVEKQYRVE